MIITVNNNRPDHKNPKKSKAQRMQARAALAQKVADEKAMEANRLEQRRLQKQRDAESAALLPKQRAGKEIAQLETEMRSYLGFSALTQRRLQKRVRWITARIAELKEVQ